MVILSVILPAAVYILDGDEGPRSAPVATDSKGTDPPRLALAVLLFVSASVAQGLSSCGTDQETNRSIDPNNHFCRDLDKACQLKDSRCLLELTGCCCTFAGYVGTPRVSFGRLCSLA